MDWIYLSKFVFGTIRGGIFYRYGLSCYSTFSYKNLIPFSQGSPSNLYHLSFSSFPYTWIVDCSSGSLSHPPPPEVFGSSCKVEKTLFRDHFLINVAKELAAEHSM